MSNTILPCIHIYFIKEKYSIVTLNYNRWHLDSLPQIIFRRNHQIIFKMLNVEISPKLNELWNRRPTTRLRPMMNHSNNGTKLNFLANPIRKSFNDCTHNRTLRTNQSIHINCLNIHSDDSPYEMIHTIWSIWYGWHFLLKNFEAQSTEVSLIFQLLRSFFTNYTFTTFN